MQQTLDFHFDDEQEHHHARRQPGRVSRHERLLHPRNFGGCARSAALRRARKFLMRDQAWWHGELDDSPRPAVQ